MTSHRLRALGAFLVASSCLAGAAPVHAGGAIYGYVDSRGVSHFTNIPSDDRYVLVTPPRNAAKRPVTPRNGSYDRLIRNTAREHDVPPALVKAVIAAESRFDVDAVSRKGAQGLMQLMPGTAAELGVADPLVADQNVRGGVRYLREMLDRFGDMSTALAAYNAGPEAVYRYRGVPPYPETRDYVKRVLTYYADYHGDFRQ